MSTEFQDDYLAYLYRLRDRIEGLIHERIAEIASLPDTVQDSKDPQVKALIETLTSRIPDWQ